MIRDKLIEMDACEEAIMWVGDKNLEQAWNDCHRGDWMLWLAAKIEVERKLIVRAACACARLALPHVPTGETRPLISIETAEKWSDGEATIEEVRKAADATYADVAYTAANAAAYAAARAAYAAYAYAAYTAANAAVYAANAAVYAANARATAYAADAVYAAARAADAANAAVYAANARDQCRKECANSIRQIIPISNMR